MSARLQQLLAEYHAALERDPQNPQLLSALGQVLQELGEGPRAAQYHFAAAQRYEQDQRLREAADSCARVLAADPGNLDAVALLRRLGDGGGAQRVAEGPVVVRAEVGGDYPSDKSTDSLDRGALMGQWLSEGDKEQTSRQLPRPRPKLRTKRPKRTVSPLDRTVVDGVEEPAQPSRRPPPVGAGPPMEGDDSPASLPTLKADTQAFGSKPRPATLEGTLPTRRPKRPVSPLDRTEVETTAEPPLGQQSTRRGHQGHGGEQLATETRAPSADRVGLQSDVPLRPKLPAGVRQIGRALSYSRGEFVLRQGDEGSDVFFIEAGQVELSCLAGEAAVPIARLEAGEFFGELGMLGDGRRHTTVRALRPTRVFVLTKGQARQLMKDDKGVARSLRRVYRDRLQEMLGVVAPALQSADDGLKARVFARGKPVALSGGETVLLRAGEPAPAFYFVLLGQLEVHGPAGHLGTLHDGDCLGHCSLLGGEPEPVNVVAPRFVQLLQLAPAQLKEILSESEELSRALSFLLEEWRGRFGSVG